MLEIFSFFISTPLSAPQVFPDCRLEYPDRRDIYESSRLIRKHPSGKAGNPPGLQLLTINEYGGRARKFEVRRRCIVDPVKRDFRLDSFFFQSRVYPRSRWRLVAPSSGLCCALRSQVLST